MTLHGAAGYLTRARAGRLALTNARAARVCSDALAHRYSRHSRRDGAGQQSLDATGFPPTSVEIGISSRMWYAVKISTKFLGVNFQL
jgi:hypothetical protein